MNTSRSRNGWSSLGCIAASLIAIVAMVGACDGGATQPVATGGANPSMGGSANPNGSGGVTSTDTGNAPATGGSSNGASTTPTSTGGSSSSANTAIGGTHSGQATYYTYNNNGSCGFTTSVSNRDFAALNAPDYGTADWCGACVDVTGPKGSVTQVIIADKCPECASGDLDLNTSTFTKIADQSAGRVQITWNFVPCNVSVPIQYHYKDGSSASWTSVLILNSRLPVKSLEFSTNNGSSWNSTDRQDYNYFQASSGFGSSSVKVRVTASTGQQLTDTLPAPSSDTTVSGATNF